MKPTSNPSTNLTAPTQITKAFKAKNWRYARQFLVSQLLTCRTEQEFAMQLWFVYWVIKGVHEQQEKSFKKTYRMVRSIQ